MVEVGEGKGGAVGIDCGFAGERQKTSSSITAAAVTIATSPVIQHRKQRCQNQFKQGNNQNVFVLL